MRILVILFFLCTISVTAQEIKHVDHKRELGINFNDSMLWTGNHAPALFLRWNRMSDNTEKRRAHAFRLGLSYNRNSFDRKIDTNDSGSDSFILIEPGIEFQHHKNFRVLYVGVDAHFSRELMKADEADENFIFTRTERLSNIRYGARPFVGFKLYLVSTIAVSFEFGYDFLYLNEKIDREQSLNGTLNSEVHTSETFEAFGLKFPSGIYLSFHF